MKIKLWLREVPGYLSEEVLVVDDAQCHDGGILCTRTGEVETYYSPYYWMKGELIEN